MDEFPGITFRTGPTGRRAGLIGGPDVWEIVRDVQGAARSGAEDPIDVVTRATGIDRSKIELAARYYASHPEDIDDRIQMNEEASRRLRASYGA